MDDVLGNVEVGFAIFQLLKQLILLEVEEVVEKKEKKKRLGAKDAGFRASRRSSGGSSKCRDDINPFRGNASEKFKKNRSPVRTRSMGRK
jgi:hypothetical protein